MSSTLKRREQTQASVIRSQLMKEVSRLPQRVRERLGVPKVLNHTVRSLDVEFDMRGIPAGETFTRLLSVQVIETNEQGCIVHSSVFIQIYVVGDDHLKGDSSLNPLSL